jgi:hypothetical protein
MALSVAVALSGCGDGRAAEPRSVGVSSLSSAAQGLCDAALLASQGDARGAATVFQDEAHEDLHVVAALLQDRDREVAARFLEVKQRLEEGLSGGDPGTISALIVDMQRALGEAADVLGQPAPLCEEGAT